MTDARPPSFLTLLAACVVLAAGAPVPARAASPVPTDGSVAEPPPVEDGVADEADEADEDLPVFLEPTLGARFVFTELNGYLGLFQSHVPTAPEDADGQVLFGGDFGLDVHVPLFHWLEVGGGVRVVYGSWDAEPWLPVELEAVGVELTGHVRFNIWFMDHWATHRPGSGGMDGGIFVELGLGTQIPVMGLRGAADADAVFLLRPMAGMIYRFGPDLHWMMGAGFAAAFAHDGWDGNAGPSLQGSFWITGVGVNLR